MWCSHIKRALKMATAPARQLPSFIIIGGQKCATTSLYDYICKHPSVDSAEVKEVHYFDLRYNMGDCWYRSHFPLRQKGIITGESTPSLIWSTPSLPSIKKMLPDAKILAVLRDPAERAVSHYYHNVRQGRETRPIAEALFAPESLRSAKGLQLGSAEYLETLRFGYISKSRYDEQIQEWDRCYKVEDSLYLPFSKIVQIDEPLRLRIFEFLSLPDHPIQIMSRQNVGVPKQPEEVDAITNRLQGILAESRETVLDRLKWKSF
jgi:hypothetical protein